MRYRNKRKAFQCDAKRAFYKQFIDIIFKEFAYRSGCKWNLLLLFFVPLTDSVWCDVPTSSDDSRQRCWYWCESRMRVHTGCAFILWQAVSSVWPARRCLPPATARLTRSVWALTRDSRQHRWRKSLDGAGRLPPNERRILCELAYKVRVNIVEANHRMELAYHCS